MAKLRRISGEETAGGVSSKVTSSTVRALGRVCPLLGRSMPEKGLRVTWPPVARKAKKVFKAEIRLALER